MDLVGIGIGIGIGIRLVIGVGSGILEKISRFFIEIQFLLVCGLGGKVVNLEMVFVGQS